MDATTDKLIEALNLANLFITRLGKKLKLEQLPVFGEAAIKEALESKAYTAEQRLEDIDDELTGLQEEAEELRGRLEPLEELRRAGGKYTKVETAPGSLAVLDKCEYCDGPGAYVNESPDGETFLCNDCLHFYGAGDLRKGTL
jgi:hypothetical protein